MLYPRVTAACTLALWLSVSGLPVLDAQGPAPSTITLTASPNPVRSSDELAATTIHWDTGDGTAAEVVVARGSSPPMTFARGARGRATATWIARQSEYTFTLYALTPSRRVLTSVRVSRDDASPPRREPHLSASPNPVPGDAHLEATIVRWDTGDDSPGRVMLSADGGPPRLLASGSTGVSTLPWIVRGSRYTLSLESADRQPLAADVTVIRAPLWTSLQRCALYTAGLMLAGVCGWLYWRVGL